jgi:hypothetical protein
MPGKIESHRANLINARYITYLIPLKRIERHISENLILLTAIAIVETIYKSEKHGKI